MKGSLRIDSSPGRGTEIGIAIFAGMTVFGFSILLDSPYTGIRMTVCGDRGCVKSVDRDSPAWGEVLPGDRIVDVNGLNISYLVFNEDPDYIRSERNLERFWISARKLDREVLIGTPAELSIDRDGSHLTVVVIPRDFPFYRATARTAPVYCAGWAFVLIVFLVMRKKINDTTIAFMIFGLFLGMNYIAAIPFAVRDVAFPYLIFRALSFLDFLSVILISLSLLHLILVFPRKRRVLINHPWIQRWLYGLGALILVVRLTKFIDNTQMTYYVPYSMCGIALIVSFTRGLFRERDPIVRRQSKWVISGFLVGAGVNLALTSIPVMFGAPIVSAELTVLPTVLIPLSIAFAITKYRLMEIDNIIAGRDA